MSFLNDEENSEAIQDYDKKVNHKIMAIICIIVIIAVGFIALSFLYRGMQRDLNRYRMLNDNHDSNIYNNIYDDVELDDIPEGNIYDDDYDNAINNAEFITSNSYVFSDGEIIEFDESGLIISVYVIDASKLDYGIDIISPNYGTVGVNYLDIKKGGTNYVIWDKCKIEFIEQENPSKLQVKVTSIEELAKGYKEPVEIKLTINEPYRINNNSVELLYNKRIDPGEYSIDFTYPKNKNNKKNKVLSVRSGLIIADDNLMVELVDDSDPIELELKVYYK